MSALPHEINPIELARKGAAIHGELPAKRLQRLQEAVVEVVSPVEVALQFDQDNYGRARIHGKISAQVKLTCQRCGELMDQNLVVEPEIHPVLSDDQAKNLDNMYDPLVTHGEPVEIKELVEEELLLSLPMVAKHEPALCKVKQTD